MAVGNGVNWMKICIVMNLGMGVFANCALHINRKINIHKGFVYSL